MIDVFLRRRRICVRLDPRSPHYESAYILVRSSLTAYEIEENLWSLSFHDLNMLKARLDQVGLVERRTMTEEAYEWVSYLTSLLVRNADLKRGVNIEQIQGALEGHLKYVPYADQLPAISFAVNNRRSGIFDEMGVGKTLEALAAVVVLGPKIRRVLVICPYTAQISFKREVEKHTHFKAIQVPSGRKRAFQFIEENQDTEWDLMLVHPENLIGGRGRGNVYGDITKLLRSMQWDLFIVDEFHLYKNLTAKRTKCVLSILNESQDRDGKRPRAILLTGTPVSESPLNAYVALKVLTQDYLPHISKFEHHFVVKQSISYGSKGTHDKVVGYRNLDELKTMIEAVSIRRTKADMTGFPDRVAMIRDVELTGKQLALYKTICGEIVAGLPRSTMINLMRFLSNTTTVLRLRQVMNHPNLLDEAGESAKYLEIDNLLEEILADPEQKVILWTEFRRAVDNLYERYNPIYGATKLYGGVTNEQLERIAFDFESMNAPRVAVAIPAKAGTGLDFLARARTAIYVERPYSFTLYKQSIDRIHRRITSGKMSYLDAIRAKPATMIFLDVMGSVDELIRDRLFGKQDLADALTTSDERLVEMGREDLIKYLQ